MIPSTPPITGDGIFDDTPLETVYVVDVNAKRVYLAQEPWNYYAIVVMPTGIEELETDKTTSTIVGCYDLSGDPSMASSAVRSSCATPMVPRAR